MYDAEFVAWPVTLILLVVAFGRSWSAVAVAADGTAMAGGLLYLGTLPWPVSRCSRDVVDLPDCLVVDLQTGKGEDYDVSVSVPGTAA